MIKKDKPLSPHLTIYKPQITSVLSIMHRITGFILFFGFLIILWTTNIYTFKSTTLEDFGKVLTYLVTNKFFISILILFSYCIFYHMCTGLRQINGYKDDKFNRMVSCDFFCYIYLYILVPNYL